MKWAFKLLTSTFIITALTTQMPAYAAWQIATNHSSTSSIPREPFFQMGGRHSYYKSYKKTKNASYKPNATHGKTPLFAVSISGSLKRNVERIMARYHWRVIWKSPNDYNFHGRVTGSSLPNLIKKLFTPFPLQAQLYMSNRTMIVIPRNIYEV